MGSQAEMGSRAEQTRGKAGGQGGGWQTWPGGRLRTADWVVPYSRADKPGGTTGEQDRPTTQGSSTGK